MNDLLNIQTLISQDSMVIMSLDFIGNSTINWLSKKLGFSTNESQMSHQIRTKIRVHQRYLTPRGLRSKFLKFRGKGTQRI